MRSDPRARGIPAAAGSGAAGIRTLRGPVSLARSMRGALAGFRAGCLPCAVSACVCGPIAIARCIEPVAGAGAVSRLRSIATRLDDLLPIAAAEIELVP
jgi:hypothetical protein